MDSNYSMNDQMDQVQAIYLAQANIFAYEARKSKKSWIPLCDSTVPISILYDNTRAIYRIISVDADIKEVVVNTTVTPELEFVKTTQKFGYWKDVGNGRVFGIGFASQFEAEAFAECLRKVKQITGPPSINSSFTLNGCSSMGQLKNGLPNQPNQLPQGHGDCIGVGGSLPFTNSPNFGGGVFQSSSLSMNRDNYEQIGQAVLSYLNANSRIGGASDGRPSTYKVDLPEGPPSSTIPPAPSRTQSKIFTTNLDELRMNPGFQMPPYHHLAYPYLPQQLASPSPLTRTLPFSTSANENTVGTSNPDPRSSMMSSQSLLSFPMGMSMPQGYCYQAPPVRQPSAPYTTTANTSPSHVNFGGLAKTKDDLETGGVGGRCDIQEEISRMKSENLRLSESLLESSTNSAMKLEHQVNSLKEDNSTLAKTLAELISNLEKTQKQSTARNKDEEGHRKEQEDSKPKESKSQIHTHRSERPQTGMSNKAEEKKEPHLREVEDMLKRELADKVRVETIMKDLEEELKRQQQINEEQQTEINYLKELGEVYKKSYADSQKKIGELLREDEDRQNVLNGVIQKLMNINDQIKVIYEK